MGKFMKKELNRKVFWLTLLVGFLIALCFFFVIYPMIASSAGWDYYTYMPSFATKLYDFIASLRNILGFEIHGFELRLGIISIPLPFYDAIISLGIFCLSIVVGTVLAKITPKSEPKKEKMKQCDSLRNNSEFDDVSLY